jgi:hypothetical protein
VYGSNLSGWSLGERVDDDARLAVAVLRTLPVAQAAAGADVSERTVERARAGQLTGHTARAEQARAKLTDHAVKHAHARLRAAATPRPPDPETTLATYLDRLRAPKPEARLCACGCGQPITGESRGGRARKYLNETHRKRAQRRKTGSGRIHRRRRTPGSH